jgi:hypothetical protein
LAAASAVTTGSAGSAARWTVRLLALLCLAGGAGGAARAGADLLVSSSAFSSVARFDAATGAARGIFVTPGEGGLDSTDGLAWGPDGNLYVMSERSNQVLRYDGASGAFLGVFVAAGSGGLETPVGIAPGADGNIYLSSLGTSEVLRYDGASGAFLGVFVPQGSGGLDGAYDLAFGPDGNLYVNSFSNGEVLRYDAGSGAFLGVFAGGNGLLGPTYLLFAPVGNTACQDDATHVCLQQGRFRVTTGWQTAAGAAGAGQAVPLSADTAYFWFFAASNVELVVKVLDGCPSAAGGHYWVFAGGLTDVAVQLTVTDTATGAVKTYLNPQSTPFAPLQDTSAFACH